MDKNEAGAPRGQEFKGQSAKEERAAEREEGGWCGGQGGGENEHKHLSAQRGSYKASEHWSEHGKLPKVQESTT